MTQEELELLQLEIAISESLQVADKQPVGTYAAPAVKTTSLSKSASSSSSSEVAAKPTSQSPSPIRSAQPTNKPSSASTSTKPPSKLSSSAAAVLNSIGNAFNIPTLPEDHCPSCGKICDYGRFINALGRRYHERCFVCAACNNPINGQFSPRGEPSLPYHMECAKMLFTPTCVVCSNNVTEQYLRHPFFEEEVYCFTHAERQSCFACNKKEPLASSGREKFVDLNDGRTLCHGCASTIIMDSSEVQAIYLKIVDYMETWQELTIPPGMRDVPVFAVDVQCLNQETAAVSGRGICCATGTVRGLTMSTRGEIRQMSGGTVKFDLRSGKVSVVPTVVKVEEVRAVTAVLVLYGLPEELMTSILAHEAMHAWLKLTKGMPFEMESKIEEGLCQVMAHKYLEHVGQQRATGTTDGLAEKEFQEWRKTELLRSYLCHSIETDSSVVYGDGFREAIECVRALGLHEVLNFLKSNGKLPVV